MTLFSVLLAVLMFACGALADSDVLLKPLSGKMGKPQLGLVFVQGTQISAAAYEPLMQAVQEALDYEAYCAIPAFFLDVPEPAQFNSKMDSAMKEMQKAGLKDSAPVVYLAHSLGGVFTQDYVFKNKEKISAQILMGATLLRKYRNGSTSKTFPVPTLMLDGTLDGLMRVTRQAESFYHYKGQSNFPIVIYEGTSHMQFASGPPPLNVKMNDLKPTVPDDKAHQMMANTIKNFITAQIAKDAGAQSEIEQEVQATAKIVAPIIEALEMEANPHLLPPCNTDYPMPSCPFYPRYPGKQEGSSPKPDGACVCGTPWVQQVAQKVVTGLGTVRTLATDGIHAVSDVNPIHLPHIWSTCEKEEGCTINVTTVTQPVYSALDSFDTGFSYESASELRVKLKSRQTMWMAAGRKDVNFTETDVVPSLCAEINVLAYQWALNHSSPAARSRFQDIGEVLEMGKDLGPYNAGPLWIYNALKYNNAKDKSKVVIQAPMMHTPVDYKIKAAAGFHYCKLLSPARALEWIYIDGLRAKGSL